MMERKNIDRLFQEKFRDFEANPPEVVWDRIEERLKKKKKRRVIPIWWKLSGVAALLLVGLAIWMLWAGDPENRNRVVSAPGKSAPVAKPATPGLSPVTPSPGSLIEGVVESDSERLPMRGSSSTGEGNFTRSEAIVAGDGARESHGESVDQNGDNGTKESILTPKMNRNPVATSDKRDVKPGREGKNAGAVVVSEQKRTDNKTKIETWESNIEKTQGIPDQDPQIAVTETPQNISPDNQAGPERVLSVQEPESAIAVQDASVKIDSAVVAAAEPNALEELLKESEKEKKVTSDANLNRWQITSNVAPIYFSSASDGSPIDSRLDGANKSYKTSVSYGAGVQYALSKRLSLRSGVNALALEYATTDIYFTQSANARQLQNVRTNLPGSLIQVEMNPGMMTASATGKADRRYSGTLNQRIGYIEVPLEMSYQIIQKRFGVSVIGGLSTLFLNQNDVSIEGTGMNMTIGEANNLNQMHFSTNLGLGIRYDFLKSLQFKLEPIVKYQLNTFTNEAGNFQPFFVGIYTGLNYRF